MDKNAPEKIYDVRLLERHLRDGKISQADYDQFLGQLPDAADNAVLISMDELMGPADDSAAG